MTVPGAVTDSARVTGSDITFQSEVGTVSGYLARPTESGPRAGIIILHDAFSLSEHFRDVARRFANIGYDALAIDMYSHSDTSIVQDRLDWFKVHFLVPDSVVVQDIVAGVNYLRALPESNGKVGALGFCGGGRQVLLAAGSNAGLSAGIACWPGYITYGSPDNVTDDNRPERVIDMTERLECPIYGVSGIEDGNPSPQDMAELDQRMKAAGIPGNVDVFPDAGHAFFADYRTDAYREDAAFKLWPKMVEFFETHLR